MSYFEHDPYFVVNPVFEEDLKVAIEQFRRGEVHRSTTETTNMEIYISFLEEHLRMQQSATYLSQLGALFLNSEENHRTDQTFVRIILEMRKITSLIQTHSSLIEESLLPRLQNSLLKTNCAS